MTAQQTPESESRIGTAGLGAEVGFFLGLPALGLFLGHHVAEPGSCQSRYSERG